VDALKKELLPALQATASHVEAEIRVSPHAARRPRI
jgi:hypothetical protein